MSARSKIAEEYKRISIWKSENNRRPCDNMQENRENQGAINDSKTIQSLERQLEEVIFDYRQLRTLRPLFDLNCSKECKALREENRQLKKRDEQHLAALSTKESYIRQLMFELGQMERRANTEPRSYVVNTTHESRFPKKMCAVVFLANCFAFRCCLMRLVAISVTHICRS
jgi:hypothetical protein